MKLSINDFDLKVGLHQYIYNVGDNELFLNWELDAENIEKKRLMIRTWIKDKKHLDNNPKIITRKNIKDLEDELKKLGYIT